MKVVEVFTARGHKAVRATHRTTLEVTKEECLSLRGDCIIAVGANKGAAELSSKFKQLARKSEAKLTLTVKVEGERELVRGWGDPRLSFSHPTDLVVRKSNYICPRTVMVRADKAAADLSRELVAKLSRADVSVVIELTVEVRG
ncbi:DUF371 domain-containing protein [Candidatus Hecatella orcuttiae]|jgi:hypothetical protein|uniref:DUF371 domain-containing protein n=1 Tax=Candidatus Hecatella orcuttiae TaxID=1935119 RepID=UPI0028680224|nr:DUF371 domain-containing protein [Candidatus Hecatella orcuttiae]